MAKANIQNYLDVRDYFTLDGEELCFSRKKDGQFERVKTYKDVDGYLKFRHQKKKLIAHRMIFLLANDYLPDYIDHINRIRDDNRLDNLRPVNSIQNSMNRSISSRNTSGHKGVTWSADHRKWCVRITYQKERHLVGYFDDKDKAVDEMKSARQWLFREYS